MESFEEFCRKLRKLWTDHYEDVPSEVEGLIQVYLNLMKRK